MSRAAVVPSPRRVYTIAFALAVCLGTATLVLGCRAPAPSAQARLDVEQMTKGPATAPVTIVEFSDYQ